mmetsp:Transcript_15224/g.41007  ORF Transcript_15224/g.41007 Transcript_15224/m.41007 type:complete len:187 (+) Transcript_15224:3-563(+)
MPWGGGATGEEEKWIELSKNAMEPLGGGAARPRNAVPAPPADPQAIFESHRGSSVRETDGRSLDVVGQSQRLLWQARAPCLLPPGFPAIFSKFIDEQGKRLSPAQAAARVRLAPNATRFQAARVDAMAAVKTNREVTARFAADAARCLRSMGLPAHRATVLGSDFEIEALNEVVERLESIQYYNET